MDVSRAIYYHECFGEKWNTAVNFPIEALDLRKYAGENVSACRFNLHTVFNPTGRFDNGHNAVGYKKAGIFSKKRYSGIAKVRIIWDFFLCFETPVGFTQSEKER